MTDYLPMEETFGSGYCSKCGKLKARLNVYGQCVRCMTEDS